MKEEGGRRRDEGVTRGQGDYLVMLSGPGSVNQGNTGCSQPLLNQSQEAWS
jgi:hypothetical protein